MKTKAEEFLTARLDEDEAAANAAGGDDRWSASQYGDGVSHEGGHQIVIGPHGYLGAEADHIARWQPRRVLAEVAAKRRILARTESNWDDNELHAILAILTTPYADHPDYRPEWNRE